LFLGIDELLPLKSKTKSHFNHNCALHSRDGGQGKEWRAQWTRWRKILI